MKGKETWIFALLLLLGMACIDESECNYETLREIKVKFIQSENLLADTLQIDSIISSNTDSVMYKQDTLSSVVLPLNPGAQETRFYFDLTNDSENFEIVFGYAAIPRVISEDCGVELEINALKIVSHEVDSVIITNFNFNKEVETNVKVYR